MKKLKELKKWYWDIKPLWQKLSITSVISFVVGFIFGSIIL